MKSNIPLPASGPFRAIDTDTAREPSIITVLCLIKVNGKTIELIVHTSSNYISELLCVNITSLTIIFIKSYICDIHSFPHSKPPGLLSPSADLTHTTHFPHEFYLQVEKKNLGT